MSVQLSQINIVVRDMDKMSEFYRRLGLSISQPPAEWAPHHRNNQADDWPVDVDLDSEVFARVWDEGWPGGTGIVLGFRVESRAEVDRLYEELTAAGYAGQQPPYDAFWGARYAVVTDPEGNAVGLTTDPDPAHRSAPPTPPFG